MYEVSGYNCPTSTKYSRTFFNLMPWITPSITPPSLYISPEMTEITAVGRQRTQTFVWVCCFFFSLAFFLSPQKKEEKKKPFKPPDQRHKEKKREGEREKLVLRDLRGLKFNPKWKKNVCYLKKAQVSQRMWNPSTLLGCCIHPAVPGPCDSERSSNRRQGCPVPGTVMCSKGAEKTSFFPLQ